MKKNTNGVNEVYGGQVVLYKNKLEVRLKKETVWLTQKQMAELFNKGVSTINEHIKNIFKEGELTENLVIRNFRITASDGKMYDTIFYNLDVIISVGYRVKSKQGTQFRIWATNVLKKHLINGYTINEKRLRLSEHKYRELQNSIKLLGNIVNLEKVSDETKGLIKIITEYSRTLDILDDYDNNKLLVPKGTKQERYKLTYAEACKIIHILKEKFVDSKFFGQEKDESFKSSIGAIYQTFAGEDVYKTVEEKAVNLLYFITKNHSFVDGNKRIAATIFICFLQNNNILLRKDGSKRIEDNTLVALTLMIAASKTQEKENMIRVILNLLV